MHGRVYSRFVCVCVFLLRVNLEVELPLACFSTPLIRLMGSNSERELKEWWKLNALYEQSLKADSKAHRCQESGFQWN